MQKIKVGFLNTHPIQYFAPLYASLNQADDLAVTAVYLSDYSLRGGQDRKFGRAVKWDVDLLSGYDARFVSGASTRNEVRGFFSMVAPAVGKEIRHSGLDVLIVHGHSPAAMILGIRAAKAAGIPVFMRGETHLGLNCSVSKTFLRKLIMRPFYRSLSGVLAIGSANADFYREMGVSNERIFPAPYVVDNARFAAAARLTDANRAEMRRAFGVPDDRPILLYSAKFEARKRPSDLLRAAALLNRESAVFHLVMVGSGEQEGELLRLAVELGLTNVHFHGFANQSAMPRIYGASDIFILPSENEPWGLAINEAMCAGLPVVASAEIGCVPDLVHDDVNGRIFSAGDVIGLANALRPLVQDRKKRVAMGNASRERISHWSFADVRDGLRMALRSVGLPALMPGSATQ